MTTRNALVLLAALAVAVPLGCLRPSGSSPQPVASASATTSSAGTTDYRTLSKVELESLIRTKTGQEAALTQKDPTHYTGQITAPGGTPLPLEVTVEAEQIILDTNAPGASLRHIITPHGLQAGTPVIR